MIKECFNCAHFTAYYTKAYCCFLREKCGRCSVSEQTVDKHFSCVSHKTKYAPKKIKRGAVLNELEIALTKINAVKLILDESRDGLRTFCHSERKRRI